jgi:hypothetical protein
MIGPRTCGLEHDPEKWVPVFRKDHAQIKEIEQDDDSKKRHPALVLSKRRIAAAGIDWHQSRNGRNAFDQGLRQTRPPHDPFAERSRG